MVKTYIFLEKLFHIKYLLKREKITRLSTKHKSKLKWSDLHQVVQLYPFAIKKKRKEPSYPIILYIKKTLFFMSSV